MIRSGYWELITNWAFVSNLLAIGVIYAITIIYFVLSPFILQKDLGICGGKRVAFIWTHKAKLLR